jgi:hypothetical protein
MPLSGDDGDPALEKFKSLKEKTYGDFSPSPLPIGPDGGPMLAGAVLEPAARPEPTEDNYICLRGPCRHFWHLVCSAGEGNPAGTFEALGLPEPREHHLTCTAHPGTETQLSFDELVFECNRWDPITSGEIAMADARRELYQIRRAKEEPVEVVEEDDVPEYEIRVAGDAIARAWFKLGAEVALLCAENVDDGDVDGWFEAAWESATQSAKGNES